MCTATRQTKVVGQSRWVTAGRNRSPASPARRALCITFISHALTGTFEYLTDNCHYASTDRTASLWGRDPTIFNHGAAIGRADLRNPSVLGGREEAEDEDDMLDRA